MGGLIGGRGCVGEEWGCSEWGSGEESGGGMKDVLSSILKLPQGWYNYLFFPKACSIATQQLIFFLNDLISKNHNSVISDT